MIRPRSGGGGRAPPGISIDGRAGVGGDSRIRGGLYAVLVVFNRDGQVGGRVIGRIVRPAGFGLDGKGDRPRIEVEALASREPSVGLLAPIPCT